MTHLAKQLAELEAMSPAQLRACWRDCYRKQAPDIGPDLLRRSIAWKLQSRVHGKLPVSTKREIKKMIARLEKGGEVEKHSNIALKTGTRLVREWRGKSYHILVCDNGFEYDGRHYDSLSHIAKYIFLAPVYLLKLLFWRTTPCPKATAKRLPRISIFPTLA